MRAGREALGDVSQFSGRETSQYVEAINLTRLVKRALGGAPLVCTGHSKGGGQCSAAAIAANIPGITFNAAGLHPRTVGGRRAGNLVRAYHVRGDPLTVGQAVFAPLAPTAAGISLSLYPARFYELYQHPIGMVVEAMEKVAAEPK